MIRPTFPPQMRSGIARYVPVIVTVALVAAAVWLAPPIETTTVRGTDDTEISNGPAQAPADLAGPADVGTNNGSTNGGTQPGAANPGERALPENCDPATGKIKFPSVYAPPCVYPVSDNGGATYQGVTKDTIKVVVYDPQSDPAVDALLRSVGAADTREQLIETYRGRLNLFNTYYETYGRRVVLEIVEASGPTDDDAAARADAIKVATQMKPFAVFGGPSPFVDELARRQIICITQSQRPNTYFTDRAPFVWGTQMSSSQVFFHLAEYIGKRLRGNAIHAGDEAYRSQPRKFGIVFSDTAEQVYRPGIEYLERELKKYGVTLADKVAYEPDINTAQEQARTIVARLKDKGITSILFSGDGLAPIFFTQEATSQSWFPEWVLSGGSLVDTNFLGRTYDQRQWSHAFGISQLWIRPPKPVVEPYYQYVWHHGRPPPAVTTYEILYQEPLVLFTGIHMAGANLNPNTFRDGLFSYPPSGVGTITQLQRSFGNHGIWPQPDYTGFDSVAEVWWDPKARGAAEQGTVADGMFRFVDGGKRYTPGQWPNSPPKVFTTDGTRIDYDSLPPSDKYPTYPPKR